MKCAEMLLITSLSSLKVENKKPGVEEVHIGDKLLYEGIV